MIQLLFNEDVNIYFDEKQIRSSYAEKFKTLNRRDRRSSLRFVISHPSCCYFIGHLVSTVN